jgi:hypothetical protein
MTVPSYRYELRRGDEVIATGHLNRETRLEILLVVGRRCVVRPTRNKHGLTSRSEATSTTSRSGAA